MAVTVRYTVDCHCGDKAEMTTLHYDEPGPDGVVTIDVELNIGQSEFRCTCGCVSAIPDLWIECDEDCGSDGDDDSDDDCVAP